MQFLSLRYKLLLQLGIFALGGMGPQQKLENDKQIRILKADLSFLEDIEDIVERLNCDHAVRFDFLKSAFELNNVAVCVGLHIFKCTKEVVLLCPVYMSNFNRL